MVNNTLFIVAIFWGVWIIIPIFFDGLFAFIYMITIFLKGEKDSGPVKVAYLNLPKVTVIIPTYNEEKNIDLCLDHLRMQTYPHPKMEIIVVDNGSTDKTEKIVRDYINEVKQCQDHLCGQMRISQDGSLDKYGSFIRLITLKEKGKAKALNTGIQKAQGKIIINIDSRSFLKEEAIYNMVKKFIQYPQYGALTGNVEIDWGLARKIDIKFSPESKPVKVIKRELTRKEIFLGKSQFLEYLVSFRLGREFQDISDSIYTLSGAFSGFKREVLGLSEYKARSLAEDTDITLDLQDQKIRIGYAKEAKAFLKPVYSFEGFFSQRVRWHRGQIEVVGLHLDYYGNLKRKFWRGFFHNSLLVKDHTFSFPRLMWTFMLPLLALFGYSMALILKVIILMWLFYILIDFLNTLFCYLVVDKDTRLKIKESVQYNFVTPFFRLIEYYFRFAGYIKVLKEPPAWSTPINPLKGLKLWRDGIYSKFNKSPLLRKLHLPLLPIAETPDKISEEDGYGLSKLNGRNGNGKFNHQLDGIFKNGK